MFFLRRQLGDMLPIPVQLPVDHELVLSSWPTCKIINSSGTVIETLKLALWAPRIDDPIGVLATFGIFWTFLHSLYAVGKYMIVIEAPATPDTDSITEAHQLEILPGGNDNGNVIANYFHGLPEANGVVYQLDDGTLNRKSNPR